MCVCTYIDEKAIMNNGSVDKRLSFSQKADNDPQRDILILLKVQLSSLYIVFGN